MKPISEPHQNFLSGISNAHTAERVLCCSSGVWQGETGFESTGNSTLGYREATGLAVSSTSHSAGYYQSTRDALLLYLASRQLCEMRFQFFSNY